jgi:hypothetical protein
MLGIHMLRTVKHLNRQPQTTQNNFQTAHPTLAEMHVEVMENRKIMDGEWDLKKCPQMFLEEAQELSKNTLF